jgi:hypothetical protein
MRSLENFQIIQFVLECVSLVFMRTTLKGKLIIRTWNLEPIWDFLGHNPRSWLCSLGSGVPKISQLCASKNQCWAVLAFYEEPPVPVLKFS